MHRVQSDAHVQDRDRRDQQGKASPIQENNAPNFVTMDIMDASKLSVGDAKSIGNDVSVYSLKYSYTHGMGLYMLATPNRPEDYVFCQNVGKKFHHSEYPSQKTQCILALSKANGAHEAIVSYIGRLAGDLSNILGVSITNPVVSGANDWRLYVSLVERNSGAVVTRIYGDNGHVMPDDMKGCMIRPGLLFQVKIKNSETKGSLRLSLSHVYVHHRRGGFPLKTMEYNP